MEKKRMYVIVGLLCVLLVIAVGTVIANKIAINKTLDKIYSSINNKENTAIYVMRTGCSYCELFESSIEENEDLGYKYIKIDLSKLNESQLSELAYKLNLGALDTDTYNVLEKYIKDANFNEEKTEKYISLISSNYISEENYNNIISDFQEHKDYQTIQKLIQEIGSYSTPTTIIVGNGKVNDRLIGYTDAKTLNSYLKEYDLVSKDKELLFNYPSSVKEFKDLLNSNEKEIIVLAKTTCSYCTNFHNTLRSYLKTNKIKISYVYLDSIIHSQEEQDEFYASNAWIDSNFKSTPTTIIVKNNEVIASLEGDVSINEFKTFLKGNGLGE